MRGPILLCFILPWTILAAPSASQQTTPTINIEARAPGQPLSDWYQQPGQPGVDVDGWGRPVDEEGFDAFGQPAGRPPPTTSSASIAAPRPPATSSSGAAPPPAATLRSGRVGPNPFANNRSMFEEHSLTITRTLMRNRFRQLGRRCSHLQ